MIGYPNWVGKSSLEISVDLYENDTKLLESTFCMVAKDYSTKKSVMINPLSPETEEEKQIFQMGIRNKERRAAEREKCLTIQPPTVEERLVLHELFMHQKSSVKHTLISDTKFETLDFCQPSAKNLHNTIFGGYLMRKGYTLAFSTAYMYIKEVPVFVSLDEITFLKPVQVGDFLQMVSHIVYTSGKYLHVEVIAEILDPQSSETKTANVFNFKFQASKDVMPVFPETYEEAVRFLSARRQHLSEEIK